MTTTTAYYQITDWLMKLLECFQEEDREKALKAVVEAGFGDRSF